MKTDNYLSLCLEQAAKSPLHYRHGCIIVRGGKVIGQGYNDHRPGFDGGALKTGQLAGGALCGPAMAELKEKLKKQRKPNQQQQQGTGNDSTFTPFERTGGGHLANTPLSMHSEMMAIHSALAASSTVSSTAFSQEKPCFKLPRGDKRKARLRADVLKRFKSAVLKRIHVNQIVHHMADHNNKAKEEDHNGVDRDDEEDNTRTRAQPQWSTVQHVVKECQRAFQAPRSGGKHHHHQKQKEKKKKEKERENGYQYDRYGQQTSPESQAQLSAFKSRRGRKNDVDDWSRGHEYESMAHEVMKNMSRIACSSAAGTHGDLGHGKGKKDYKRSGKMRLCEPPQPEPMLLPKGHASLSTADRKKHPRLLGADLYVARLGWNKCRDRHRNAVEGPQPPAPARLPLGPLHSGRSRDDPPESLISSAASLSSTTSSGVGSLHDELLNPAPRPSHPSTPAHSTSCSLAASSVRESRPCYRCISYMHSVGIKRVFWTNDDGVWEGGKVRDLVDALDDSMESVAEGGPLGNGVFVTKHEVLMLKRMMGNGGKCGVESYGRGPMC